MTKVAKLLGHFSWYFFTLKWKQPAKTQSQVWSNTHSLLKNAPFWKERGLHADLKNNPITTFSDYEAALALDFQSSYSSLNGEMIVFCAESSGTSGQIKHFPITQIYNQQLLMVNLAFFSGMFRRFPHFMNKGILYLAAPGNDQGLISSFDYQSIHPLVEKIFKIPKNLMKDPALYRRWKLYYACASELDTIICMAPSRVKELISDIQSHRQDLLADLLNPKNLPSSLKRVKIKSSRIELLKRVLNSQNAIKAEDLWPDLNRIICWKSGPCTIQLPLLDECVDVRIPRVDLTYSATEGRMNVPLFNDKNGGPPLPSGVISEFIEEGKEIIESNLIALHELEVGKIYEIFLTNKMGLVRYRLFDLVLCNGKFLNTPCIEFVGKSSNVIILGWTRISESDLYQAFLATGFIKDPTTYFSVGINPAQNGLVVTIKNTDITLDNWNAETFDLALQGINSYYQSDRKNQTLIPIQVKVRSPNEPLEKTHLQSKPNLISKS